MMFFWDHQKRKFFFFGGGGREGEKGKGRVASVIFHEKRLPLLKCEIEGTDVLSYFTGDNKQIHTYINYAIIFHHYIYSRRSIICSRKCFDYIFVLQNEIDSFCYSHYTFAPS